MGKLLLEQQKGDRDDRLIQVAAQKRFTFPFFSTIISGHWLLAA